MNFKLDYKQFHQFLNALKLIADMLSVVSGYSLAFTLAFLDQARGTSIALPDFRFWLILGMVIITHIVIFAFAGLYKKDISILNFEETRKIIKAVSLGVVMFILLGFVFNLDLDFIKVAGITGLGITAALILLERHLFYRFLRYNHRKGIGVKRVVIFDVCLTGKMLLKKFFEMPQLGFLPVGFIDEKVKPGNSVKTNSSQIKAEVPVLGKIKDLARIKKNYEIEELLVATPAIKKGDMRRIISACKRNGLEYSFIPNLLEDPLHRSILNQLGGIPFIRVNEPRRDILFRLFKRLIDLVLSVIILVLISPILVVIAMLIKRDSAGPIIFKQKRSGQYGRSFVMYKFRTMKQKAPKYKESPNGFTDKRITPLGRFLRKTSLDELPQFVNVLKGEMSIVGPRPEMEFIVKKYNAYQRERLSVKPGITGVWQLTADRGRAIHENLDYDFYYMDNMSILLDFLIILRTLLFAFRGVGAF